MRRKKIEPLMNTEYKALDKVFNDGWEQFVNEIRDKNDMSNYRLLKLIEKIKGELFVSEIKVFLKRVDYGMLRIVKNPVGMCIGENRFATFNQVWISQKSIAGGIEGSICIQIKENKFLIAKY